MQSCGLETINAFHIINVVIYPGLSWPVVQSTHSEEYSADGKVIIK